MRALHSLFGLREIGSTSHFYTYWETILTLDLSTNDSSKNWFYIGGEWEGEDVKELKDPPKYMTLDWTMFLIKSNKGNGQVPSILALVESVMVGKKMILKSMIFFRRLKGVNDELKKRETDLEVDLVVADEQASKQLIIEFSMIRVAISKKYPQFEMENLEKLAT
ncbi:hypothetical protein FNV43_RR05795 [Rhamnella rubrinervis]|uniref:Uncharacterized protein n=1 Tax=Rhamnella rubrinervis TaxID=2594499 RepID=A0A8K0MQZ9_9ROSA|nr:hypothetical protein FNV43_RR05795 [Rhamnella rubrinervis]